MKYLGIDYGRKKIGLAISDDMGKIAFPRDIIKSNKDTINFITKLVEKEDIEKIVVGKSINMDGSINKLQKYIEFFTKKLSKNIDNRIKIELEDERMSSISARSHLYGKGNIENEHWTENKNKKRRDNVDAGAAAIILQRYLDKK